MKKVLGVILAVLMAASAIAFADTMVQDETYTNAPANPTHENIVEIRASFADEAEEEYDVVAMLPTELTVNTLGEIFDFVEINLKCVAHYFPEETQQEIDRIAATKGLTKEDLYMPEFMSQMFEPCYEPADVRVDAEMKLDYAVGRPVIVVIGWEDEAGEVQWRALDAEIYEKDVISYTVPADLLEIIHGRESLWSVLTVKPGMGGWKEENETPPEYVPSKTVEDMTKAESVFGEDGEEIEELKIIVVDPDQPAQDEIELLTEHIAEKKKSVISYFTPEIQRQTGLLLPKDVDPETLVAYEVVCLRCENYIEPYGDVTARFAFATPYENEKPVTVLLALFDEEDEPVVWTPLHAEVVDGRMEITFSATVLPTMMEETALALVLSEPLEEE